MSGELINPSAGLSDNNMKVISSVDGESIYVPKEETDPFKFSALRRYKF
jgi:hypothetical protein